YDALGLIKQESKSFGGPPYQTNYDYNRQGDQTLITNPDGSQIQYLYNSAGLLDSVQRKESTDSSFANVASFHYSPTEQVATTTYANGQVTTNTYDATKLYRLTSKVTTIAAGSHAQNLAYTYDPVGNILQIVDNSATSTKKTVNYGYDDLYRLTSATATGVAAGQQPYSQTYAYDAIGNLTSKSDQGNYTYAGNQGTSYANPHAVTSISSGGTSTELLTSPWHLSGNNGSAEAYQSVDPNILNSKSSITVTYDLHGLCALGGDASALVIDQPGSWGTYVSLSNYGQNCHNGPQTITIPLSDFPGLNTNQPLGFNGSFHVRFWYGSAFTVDITSLKINAAPRITAYPSKFYNTDWITPVKHILAGSVEVATITGSGSSEVLHYL